MEYSEATQKIIDQARARIARSLLPLETLTPEQAGSILAQYRLAVEPNFIAWMMQARQYAQSERAKAVLEQNLHDEITQDHPAMLRAFATSCGVIPTRQAYQKVAEPVLDLWRLFGETNSLQNLVVAMILENTSPIFIPYLAQIGKKLGCQDFTYTHVHGVADIQHARELYEGALEEMSFVAAPLNTLHYATDKTLFFLEKILTP